MNTSTKSAPDAAATVDLSGATARPWRTWDVMAEGKGDEYPEPHEGDLRIIGANNICVGVIFGGYASLPECEVNAALIVEAVNTYDSRASERAVMEQALDTAHAEINAIGGVPTNEYERGLNDAVGQALAILERLGARDPVCFPRTALSALSAYQALGKDAQP